MPDPNADALRQWKERLDFLLAEEAKLGPDPSQRWAVSQQIEQARERIRELSALCGAARVFDARYLPAAWRFRLWAGLRIQFFGFRCVSWSRPEP